MCVESSRDDGACECAHTYIREKWNYEAILAFWVLSESNFSVFIWVVLTVRQIYLFWRHNYK